jgi:protein-disulfide isomerase
VVKDARQSKTPFYAALGVIALVGVGALGWLATRGGSKVATLDPNLPPVQATGYTKGSATAPVEVLEFADFECPACAGFATITEPDVRTRLIETGQIRLRFFDFPINEEVHKHSLTASLAAACANEQGKVWEMHDALFASQDRWSTEATGNPRKVMDELARQVGLALPQYEQCMDAKKYQAQVVANRNEATRVGVNSTPSFIIGGKLYSGALAYDQFKAAVDEAASRGPKAGAPAVPGGPTVGAPSAGAPAGPVPPPSR